MDKNDWAPEPWRKVTQQFQCTDAEPFERHVIKSNDDKILFEVLGHTADVKRFLCCLNACAGVPTECLIRVEQGKSSIIVADEVLNGQRAHFEMPESTITKEAADGRSDNKP